MTWPVYIYFLYEVEAKCYGVIIQVIVYEIRNKSAYEHWKQLTLKTVSCHDANLKIVATGNISYHNDKLCCHQWRQYGIITIQFRQKDFL